MEYKITEKMNKISAENPVDDSKKEDEEPSSFASTETFEGWFYTFLSFVSFRFHYLNSIPQNLS